MAFQFTFGGVTYYAAIRAGESGWIPIGAPSTVPETPINAAFTAGGAGTRVVLLDATYSLSAAGLSFTANSQILEGQGRGSLVDGTGAPAATNAITLSGFTDCVIRNLAIDTKGATGAASCIFIEDGADRFRVENVTIVDSDLTGIVVEGTTIDDGWIIGCSILDADNRGIDVDMDGGHYILRLIVEENSVFSTTNEGMYIEQARSSVISSNVVSSSGDDGICIAGDSDWNTITGNTVTNSVDHGFSITGAYSTISENVSYLNGMSGFYIGSCTDSTITGNTSISNTQHGIFLSTSDRCTVSSNICALNDSGDSATYDGINVEASDEADIIGNVCYGNHRRGIYADSLRCSVIGNKVSLNDREGIYCEHVSMLVSGNYLFDDGQDSAGTYHEIFIHGDSSICLCTGNYISSPGDSSEDCIHIVSGGFGHLILNNYCYNGMGSGITLAGANDVCAILGNYLLENDDYGVEIVAATADDNMVKNNYFDGNGISPILDSGTNTMTHHVETAGHRYMEGGSSATQYGMDIDSAGETVYDFLHLSAEVQQILRVEIWGIASPVTGGSATSMRINLRVEGGASNEIFTTHTVQDASLQAVESAFAASDVIHWVLSAGIGVLQAGDQLRITTAYAAAAGGDVDTDFRLQTVLAYYV